MSHSHHHPHSHNESPPSGASSAVSSTSDHIRVVARINGDESSPGKVVSFSRSDSLSAILSLVSSRFSDEITKLAASSIAAASNSDSPAPIFLTSSSKFTHVFALSGAEITDAGDLREDDVLIFAFDSKLIDSSGSVSHSQVAKRQFLHQIASTAVAQALQLYDSTSAFVKARSPSVVASTLQKLEVKAKEIASNPSVVHAASTAYAAAEPAVNWADSKLDVVYDRLKAQSSDWLDSERVKQVNQLLLEPVRARILTPVDHFYSQLKDAYQSLDTSGTGSVSFEDFKTGVKSRLGNEWNERLVEPLTHFYSVVKNEFESAAKTGVDRLVSVRENAGTNVSQAATQAQDTVNRVFTGAKAKLGSVWENSVKENLTARKEQAEELLAAFNATVQSKVKEPVQAFVASAFDAYRALFETSADQKVTPAEFLAGMRVKLHAVWSDKLVPHAERLYTELQKRFDDQKAKLAGNGASLPSSSAATASGPSISQ